MKELTELMNVINNIERNFQRNLDGTSTELLTPGTALGSFGSKEVPHEVPLDLVQTKASSVSSALAPQRTVRVAQLTWRERQVARGRMFDGHRWRTT